MTSAGSELFCPECGYSLRGIESERCPECGFVLDWKALGASRIPWVYREQIGAWRAYWRTVWLTMLDSRLISDDVQRPVSFEDAAKFRRITVWVAWAPLAIALAIGFVLASFGLSIKPHVAWMQGSAGMRFAIVLDWLMLPVMWAAIYLFLMAITGVHSYFFHPNYLPVVRQNRAIALSYYACAPLAWTPVTAALVAGFVGLMSSLDGPRRVPVLLVALLSLIVFGLVALQTVGWWLNALRLLKRTTQCSAARTIAMGAMLPVLWLILLVVVGLGIPAAYALVCLVILSLWG